MASQEQLASLLHDDNDDEDSTSSSSASLSSNDHGSNGSSCESTADLPMERLSPPAKEALPEPPSSSSQPREISSPPTLPAKKRIKIGFALDLEGQKTKRAHPDIAPNSCTLVDVRAKEMANPRHNEAMTPPARSPPPKTKLKLPHHKAILERAFTEEKDSLGADNTSGDNHEAAFVVFKEDEHVNGVPRPTDPADLKSSPGMEMAATSNTPKTRTRPSTPSTKPIRFPPMSSPGLLTSIPPAGAFRETVDPVTGLATPAAVFAHAMALAGYTLENRTKKPHRGSSVQRVVDDMFDSNVKFALHFPKLIPDGLVNDEVSGKLMRAFRSSPSHSKKRRLPGFADMAPKSLTIPYPEEYIQRRMEYIEKVAAREQSIVKYQEQELALDEEREQLELAGKSVLETSKPTVVIPPIPEPPSPPRIRSMDVFDPDLFEDNHPLYPPKAEGDQSLVGHLDKDCFHVVDGRYFGLSSNRIADPNFCGPNAPGLHGLSLSGGTGLAIANTGGGSSSTLLTAPAQSGASVNANPNSKQNRESKGAKLMTDGKKRKVTQMKTSKAKNGEAKKQLSSPAVTRKKIVKPADASSKKKTNGPTPTATLNDLRKSLEAGGDEAEVLHKCIVRSAVYASRCGKHSRSWRAPNGKVYPDIGKAFRCYAKIKQCEKCKDANMDAYHCRLRKRHKDPDYNGEDSFAAWAPLFQVPMEQLVVRVPEKTKSLTSEGRKSTTQTATAVLGALTGDEKTMVSAESLSSKC